jgi:acetyl/propionyl-CoA carboxylase alpha subunit
MKKLLIANRGEIAIRIGRTANELGYSTIAVFPEDDAKSLHVTLSDEAFQIPGEGAAAYLNKEAIINIARIHSADAIHPGYGFLSENSEFAKACNEARIIFVGPTHQQLAIFGNKAATRLLAAKLGVPLVPGTNGDTPLAEVLEFQNQHSDKSILIKAISGGGGRGMRIVEKKKDVEKSFARCKSEANLAFGDDRVYVELLIPHARHVEVQVAGDGTGKVTHLWERDCSAQRQNQKIIEIAPSPNLPEPTRSALLNASLNMASEAKYQGVGTFEFLVNAKTPSEFFFSSKRMHACKLNTPLRKK